MDAPYWAGLALLFAAASADEVAGIHEAVGAALNDGGSVFVYLIPGALLLLGVAFAVRGFFARLPESTRRPLAWGFGTWVLGAVGLEVVEALARLTARNPDWDCPSSARRRTSSSCSA